MTLFLDTILLIAAGQGFFLSICLFMKKGRPGKIFSVIVFLMSYNLLVEYIYVRFGWRDYWVMLFFKEAFGFTYGPLLLLYVSIVTDKITKLRKRDLLHFVPFIGYIFVEMNTINPFLVDFTSFNSDLNDLGISRYRIIIYFMKFLSLSVYLMVSLTVVRQYKRKICDYFSDTGKIGLNWLQFLIRIMIGSWLSGLIATLIFVYIPEYNRYVLPLPFVIMSTFIYIVGYYALLQPDIYSIIHGVGNDRVVAGNMGKGKRERQKYAKSMISEDLKQGYIEKIMLCFEKDKVYLNPDLTLRDLSDLTGIPSHTISQVLNESMDENFFSLVNRYRVEYARQLLDADGEKISIIDTCFRSGFNSKSSFNIVFKKHLAVTPSQYRKKQMRYPGKRA
jgi:AraC-like DNA-binding protein